jgi:hypothetical protein
MTEAIGKKQGGLRRKGASIESVRSLVHSSGNPFLGRAGAPGATGLPTSAQYPMHEAP